MTRCLFLLCFFSCLHAADGSTFPAADFTGRVVGHLPKDLSVEKADHARLTAMGLEGKSMDEGYEPGKGASTSGEDYDMDTSSAAASSSMHQSSAIPGHKQFAADHKLSIEPRIIAQAQVDAVWQTVESLAVRELRISRGQSSREELSAPCTGQEANYAFSRALRYARKRGAEVEQALATGVVKKEAMTPWSKFSHRKFMEVRK